jgi:hypothetical protein
MVGDVSVSLRTTEGILCFKSRGILSPSSVRVSRCGHCPQITLYVRNFIREREVAERNSMDLTWALQAPGKSLETQAFAQALYQIPCIRQAQMCFRYIYIEGILEQIRGQSPTQ